MHYALRKRISKIKNEYAGKTHIRILDKDLPPLLQGISATESAYDLFSTDIGRPQDSSTLFRLSYTWIRLRQPETRYSNKRMKRIKVHVIQVLLFIYVCMMPTPGPSLDHGPNKPAHTQINKLIMALFLRHYAQCVY